MPLPKHNAYTIEDIYALPDGQRAELIDGQIYDMAPPSRIHQKISTQLVSCINHYISEHHGNCEVYAAPFAVFLNKDNKNYVEPDVSVIPTNWMIKAAMELRIGLLRLFLQAVSTLIILPNCSNTVLPVFVNTGLLIH